MKPVRLQIVGLRSWKTRARTQFHDVDLAAVIGPTGAGKSSILEAIVYALYNSVDIRSNRRRLADLLGREDDERDARL